MIQTLNEKAHPQQTTFLGIGGNNLGSSLGEITLKIKLLNGNFISDTFFVVRNITNYFPKTNTNYWSKLTGKLADENYQKQGKINVLLGAGIWIQIVESGILKSDDQNSIAHKTKLGYVIFEKTFDPYELESPYIGSISKGTSMKKLMQQIQRLWEVEEVPHLNKRTKEEERCEEIFEQLHSRDQFGRYIVRMPFNEKINAIGKSKKMALSQFFAMERRMKRNSEFGDKYRIFMTEYEALGHMQPVYEEKENGYYTPHHGVLSSGKFRVVFNASAKTTTGISLNEAQLVGERLQGDLFIILIKFRQFKFGIIADIEKMYRQVLIHSEDRKYQKILWRNEEKDPVQVYELKTVTYGQACAPHCAVRALVQCAYDHEKTFPDAAKIARECFYVDDLLTGASTLERVAEIQREITSLLKLGGFNITKWKTNGAFEEYVELEKSEEPSVLGLCWNLSSDRFFFKLREEKVEKDFIWTKRKVLSKIGKLYDPNGYLGPVIMKGKLIIQDLWKDKLDWDQEIKGALNEKWQSFNENLKDIKTISINRWLGTTENMKIQLHGFCDASEKGYGAVVYSRIKMNDQYITEIIASKSRVAPLKVITIPRLELCAANLLGNLLEVIIPTFSQKLQIYCWSDSQIVLQWLNKSSSTLKTYVANRVANIQTKSDNLNFKWNWISGNENPADLISRGTTIGELRGETKWWKGPTWLNKKEAFWPEQPKLFECKNNDEIIKEFKVIHLTTSIYENKLIRGKWFKFSDKRQGNFELLEAYGDFKRLLKVTATIFRACHNFKNLSNKLTNNFSKHEVHIAENYLIRQDQGKTFPKEIAAARNNEKALLVKLVIIWDNEDQILRIDGRVRSENLTKDEQFPIVLAKDGFLAPLLIRHAHRETGHGGTQLILQYLRKKYWIMGARRMTKNIVRKCPTCFRLRMTTSEQLMATLPTIRTTPKRAFLKVGVDYAGPVMVRSSLGRLPKLTKAWIAVFVCLVTRAIHLELVSDDTTNAFIAALKRMVSRRGIVEEIISDNAKNFVGADNYLRHVIEELDSSSKNLEEKFNFKWTFATPNAPHHGGIYEAAVKSIKYHLVRIIGNTTLTFEEYSTVLCQAEACVNSRPLAPLTDDPTSLNALTPGHFLIGEELVRIPDEEDYKDTNPNRLNRWNHLQKMIQHFWQRWNEEYLNTLINRSKWLEPQRNMQIGDLVIVKEDNVPPLKWKLARIQELLPGSDNMIRSVIIRTEKGVYKRPIVKLGLLIPSED